MARLPTLAQRLEDPKTDWQSRSVTGWYGDTERQREICRIPLCGTIAWLVRRWPMEVTFRETRDHLGVETQRQWFDQAIARTTPCLLALFSIVTLLGTRLGKRARLAVSDATWYRKQRPTFADTLAAVRREIWVAQGFSMSHSRTESRKLPNALCGGVLHALCHAA